MARPKKNNADYFSHDADMRNHRKMKAIRAKFGLEGYAIWNMVLEVLSNADFFKIEFDEVEVELLAGDFGIESEKLQEMLIYFRRLKLIKEDEGFLFSPSLIERMQPLLDVRSKKRLWAEGKNTKKDGKNDNSKVLDGKNKVLDGKSAQSKVKESKVKESKVKNFLTEQKKSEKQPSQIENELREFINNNSGVKRRLFSEIEKGCGKTLSVDEKKAIAARVTVFCNDYALRDNWDSNESNEKKLIRLTNYIINSVNNGFELVKTKVNYAKSNEPKGYQISDNFKQLLDEMAASKESYGF